MATWQHRCFVRLLSRVLPDLGIAPDTEIKPAEGLVAQEAARPRADVKLLERAQLEEARKATLPSVVGRQTGGGEVVYAAANNNSILMPDLRGHSVRDVARACAQLGLLLEARGEGRVTGHSPAPGTEVEPGQLVYVDFSRAN